MHNNKIGQAPLPFITWNLSWPLGTAIDHTAVYLATQGYPVKLYTTQKLLHPFGNDPLLCLETERYRVTCKGLLKPENAVD